MIVHVQRERRERERVREGRESERERERERKREREGGRGRERKRGCLLLVVIRIISAPLCDRSPVDPLGNTFGRTQAATRGQRSDGSNSGLCYHQVALGSYEFRGKAHRVNGRVLVVLRILFSILSTRIAL